MREETPERGTVLRSGYTTGACATATSLAAARLLLGAQQTDRCTIILPRGEEVEFKLKECRLDGIGAYASTIKDAGDDPDATHGATVFAKIELSPEPGTRFHAAEGVGTVTRAGLPLSVGEPAINPVPREMIQEHLQDLSDESGYDGGFEVHIGVVNGEKIAEALQWSVFR